MKMSKPLIKTKAARLNSTNQCSITLQERFMKAKTYRAARLNWPRSGFGAFYVFSHRNF